ncbi:MAG: hypothetical protein PWP06_399 [Candidatus Marinimicrobia bacterium]|jgi:hypothetical protein|nr:hypothetical protein [Candidatus Neomarinimicrobiota bacterium]
MNSIFSFSKSITLIPVQEKHISIIWNMRKAHPAWQHIRREHIEKAVTEKWSGTPVSRWLITIQDRIYGEIGWKSYTPGEYLYLDVIVYRKELYRLDLARHCIVPFVRMLSRNFRIHTIRCSILRPDPMLEKFLGSMNFRQISVRHVPERDIFPGGVMASYEVECDHLIHKFTKVPNIRWKSLQLIPFKLLDTDSAPLDFSESLKTFPHVKKLISLKSRKDLVDYYSSLPITLDVKTVLFTGGGEARKIGTAILNEEFPDSMIWHPLYQTQDLEEDLFACVLDLLRDNPTIRSGHVHKAEQQKICLLKTFNFIQDAHDAEGFSSWHLETVALPERDLLLNRDQK